MSLLLLPVLKDPRGRPFSKPIYAGPRRSRGRPRIRPIYTGPKKNRGRPRVHFGQHEKCNSCLHARGVKHQNRGRPRLHHGQHDNTCASCRQIRGIRLPRRGRPSVDVRKSRRWLRNKLITILGGFACVKCGFNIAEILEIHHKNGNGSADRKKYRSSHALMKFYVSHPDLARQELEVLCPNCHKLATLKIGHARKLENFTIS